jgi:hypothetical protein
MKSARLPLVASELHCWSVKEAPDVIGWDFRGKCFVLECKISVSDFQADKKKPHRAEGCGLGNVRYFVVPKGLIAKKDVPVGWGLIETSGRGLRMVKRATYGTSDRDAERLLLISLARGAHQPEYRKRHHLDG